MTTATVASATATANSSATSAPASTARRPSRRTHSPGAAAHAAHRGQPRLPGPAGPLRVAPGPSSTRRHLALAPASSTERSDRATPRRSAVATPRPNYLLRRVTVATGALLLLLAVVAAVALVLTIPAGFGGAPAVASGAPPAAGAAASPAPATHVARPGDTLWSIAAEHRGDIDHRDYVDALVALNGTSIQAGQLVDLP